MRSRIVLLASSGQGPANPGPVRGSADPGIYPRSQLGPTSDVNAFIGPWENPVGARFSLYKGVAKADFSFVVPLPLLQEVLS